MRKLSGLMVEIDLNNLMENKLNLSTSTHHGSITKEQEQAQKFITMIFVSKMQRKVRHLDTISMVIVVASLILAKIQVTLTQNDVYYKIGHSIIQSEKVTGGEKYESTDTNEVMRFIVFIATVVICALVAWRYKILYEIDQKIYDGQADFMSFLPYMLAELIICCICPIPLLNITFEGEMQNGEYIYSLDDFLLIFMMLKLYWLFRILDHYSKWTNEKANRYCARLHAKSGFGFTLKSEMMDRPQIIIGMVIFLLILVLGVVLQMLERGYVDSEQTNHEYFTDSAWLIVITMATVGYGDFSPRSHAGRATCAIAALLGMVLVSALVASISLSIEFTPSQVRAYGKIKLAEAKEKAKKEAARVIREVIRLRCDKSLTLIEKMIVFNKIRQNAHIFDEMLQESSLFDVDNGILMEEMELTFHQKIREIKHCAVGLDKLFSRCQELYVISP